MRTDTRQRNSVLLVMILLVVCFLCITPLQFVHADHLPGTVSSDPPLSSPGILGNNNPQPCRNVGAIIQNRPIQVIQGQPGNGQGEVPVYDNDVTTNLNILIDAMMRTWQYTQLQDGDVQRTAEYLRLLCEKEYEQDHTLQHAWAGLIGDFVSETKEFVESGLMGNPIFLVSQPIYYQLVNTAVSRVFLNDIVDSNIGDQSKRNIVEMVTAGLYAYEFPYLGAQQLAQDNLAQSIARDQGGDFWTNGGYETLNELFFNELGGADDDIETNALAALELRKAQQIAYEQEKLNWGDGFYSYEICDLSFQNQNPEDRRNCRIATPGSLIQDQVSFVFGSALRQMELNDEYEEWIAPNTLAVLSDILSDRGLNTNEARNPYPGMVTGNGMTGPNISTDPISPVDIQDPGDPDYVDLAGTVNGLGNPRRPPSFNGLQPNADGPNPFEFSGILTSNFFVQNVPVGSVGAGVSYFGNVLDPACFLNRIQNPGAPPC